MVYIPEVQSSNRPLVTDICIWDRKKAVPKRCFYKKSILKINSKLTGEQSCGSMVSIKLQKTSSPPVNLLHFFKIPFRKNTSGRLLLAWTVSTSALLGMQYHCFLVEPFLFQLSVINYFLQKLLWVLHLNVAHYLLNLDFRTVHTKLQQYCCMHTVHTALMKSAHGQFSPDKHTFM